MNRLVKDVFDVYEIVISNNLKLCHKITNNQTIKISAVLHQTIPRIFKVLVLMSDKLYVTKSNIMGISIVALRNAETVHEITCACTLCTNKVQSHKMVKSTGSANTVSDFNNMLRVIMCKNILYYDFLRTSHVENETS